MCEALRSQVEDLNEEKKRRDAELEIFQHEVDVRVQEWKVQLVSIVAFEIE